MATFRVLEVFFPVCAVFFGFILAVLSKGKINLSAFYSAPLRSMKSPLRMRSNTAWNRLFENSPHHQYACSDDQHSLMITKANTRLNTVIRPTETAVKPNVQKRIRRVRFSDELTVAEIEKVSANALPTVTNPSMLEAIEPIQTSDSKSNAPKIWFDPTQLFSCGPESAKMKEIPPRSQMTLPISMLSAKLTEWQEASTDIFTLFKPSWINQATLPAVNPPDAKAETRKDRVQVKNQ